MTLTRFVARTTFACLLTVACTQNGRDSRAMAANAPAGIRYEAHVAAGGAVPSAAELKNPNAVTPQSATAGGDLFASMNCDGCHGGGATGWVGPSLVDGRWRYGGADEEIFSSIYYGRPKGMPAYGGVIGADGVWLLVAYLQAQPRPSVVPTTSYEGGNEAPAPAPAPAAASEAAESATTPDQMLTRYGCIACHAVDHKVIGPPLQDVAAKYRGQADAEARLSAKVRAGGSGVWGDIPMSPNPQVPDEDLHTLMKWVLALK